MVLHARKNVPANGDCFFNSVSAQLDHQITGTELRQKTFEHLLSNEVHYQCYLTTIPGQTAEEKTEENNLKVNEVKQQGHWNNDISDIVPLAVSNLLQ